MRRTEKRDLFCDYAAKILAERSGGLSASGLIAAYIAEYPSRSRHTVLASGLHVWLKTDPRRRFYRDGDAWCLKDECEWRQ